MSDYVKSSNFTAKDSLPTGNSGKIVKGAEIDTEFTAVASAISSKANINSPTFTGTPAAPTASSGTNTTQLANTAFVKAAIDALGTIGTMAAQDADDVAITGGTAVFSTVSGSSIEALAGSTIEGGQITFEGGTSFSTYNKVIDVLSEDLRVFGGGNWDVSIFSTTGIANLTVQGSITAGGNNVITTATKLGLGITGETWHAVSKSQGITYTNSYGYPIAVFIGGKMSISNQGQSVSVGGVEVGQFSGGGASAAQQSIFFIVPAGLTYSCYGTGFTLVNWSELY